MTDKVYTEGITLSEAVNKASEELSVSSEQVRFNLDQEHFKTRSGRSKAVDFIRIEAWVASAEELHDEANRLKTINEQREVASVEQNTPHPVGDVAKEWLHTLMTHMDIPVEIAYNVKSSGEEGNHMVLLLNSEKGGRIVGRRGSSLEQFKHLLNRIMKTQEVCSEEEWSFSIDVLREDGGRGNDRGERRNRNNDDRRDRKRRRLNDKDVAKLKGVASKLAEQVIENKQSVVIGGKVFNNFERRIIHQVIADMDGVSTESFDDEGVRRIRILYCGDEAPESAVEE